MIFFWKAKSHNKRTTGFTLIELLVVISIIAILSTIVLISVSKVRAKARDATRFSDIRQINNAIQLYISDKNKAPPSDGTTDFSNVTLYSAADWNWDSNATFKTALNKYLKNIPNDPCGPNCPGVDGTSPWYGYAYYAVPDTTRYLIHAERLETRTGAYGFNYTNYGSLVPGSGASGF